MPQPFTNFSTLRSISKLSELRSIRLALATIFCLIVIFDIEYILHVVFADKFDNWSQLKSGDYSFEISVFLIILIILGLLINFVYRKIANARKETLRVQKQLNEFEALRSEADILKVRYDSVINAHDLLVINRDSLGRISSINGALANLLNIEASDLVGSSFDELVRLIDSLQPENKTKGNARKGAIIGTVADGSEQRIKLSDGGERWIRWQEKSLRDKSKNIGSQIVGADITFRKLSELKRRDFHDQDREARLAKSQFLAMVSHEIRTPLNGILGMVELMLLGDLKPIQRDYSHTIQKSARALLSLIDEILDLASVEAGKFTIESNPYDLSHLMLDTAELLAPRANHKGLEVALYLDPHLPLYLCGDQKRIRQVLLNLAGNAIKFTDYGGITIEARFHSTELGEWHEKPQIRFDVRDTGQGIPKSARDKLFEDFEQGDSTHARRHDGTGLGLSISRRLINAMGGRIEVDSTVGMGSVFTAFIPLERDTTHRPAKRFSMEDVRKHNYLIATRLERHGDLISELLSRLGAETTIVRNKQSLFNSIRLNDQIKPFDTIITSRTFDNQNIEELIAELLDKMGEANFLKIRIIVMASPKEIVSGIDVQKLGHSVVSTPHTTEALIEGILLAHTADAGKAINSLKQLEQTENSSNLELNKISVLSATDNESQNEDVNFVKAKKSIKGARLPQLPHNILLAEDNVTNARVAKAFLRHLGLTVQHVENGKEAVDWVEDKIECGEKIDLIFMDVRMPEMDGLSAVKLIRNIEEAKKSKTKKTLKIPIIALTANVRPEDYQDCIAAGMDYVITKPVGYEQMKSQILQVAPKLIKV